MKSRSLFLFIAAFFIFLSFIRLSRTNLLESREFCGQALQKLISLLICPVMLYGYASRKTPV